MPVLWPRSKGQCFPSHWNGNSYRAARPLGYSILVEIIADLSRPLLGPDFLWASSLSVDLKQAPGGHRDLPFRPFGSCQDIYSSPWCHLKLHLSVWYTVLRVPDSTVPKFSQPSTKHGVEHFIITEGPPIHAHARRLPPDKLALAKTKLICKYGGPGDSP